MVNGPILEVQELTLVVGSKAIVDSVSFSLDPGRILAILGPNGAGKSSLLKGILGLNSPTRGTVRIFGRDVSLCSAEERAQVVAYVPQQSALNLDLTVEAVVRMGRFAHRHKSGERRESDANAVMQAMQQSDVLHLASRRFLSLSGGERGRVLIARALATEAPLLLLDEPTHSLDVAHSLDCLENLRRLANLGKTIVMVTHDLNQLMGFADELLLMRTGQKLAWGSPADLLEQRVVEEAFQVRLIPRTAYGFARLPPTEGLGLCAE
jgi:ABC-type cobalamin/Fe3+-siderophores transport system ATPase subunit